MNNKLLRAVIIYGVTLASIPYYVYADENDNSAPLKIYVPNIASLPPSEAMASSEEIYFVSNNLEYDSDNLTVFAKGDAQIKQGNRVIKADTIEYDQMDNTVTARGNVTIFDSHGQVNYADEIELKDGIKDNIIHSFQAQFAGNDMFTATEAKKLSQEQKETSVAEKIDIKNSDTTTTPSFFDRLFTHLAPDSKETTDIADNAPELADLAPAAGEVATPPQAPIINNVPLITMPDAGAAPIAPLPSIPAQTQDNAPSQPKEATPEQPSVIAPVAPTLEPATSAVEPIVVDKIKAGEATPAIDSISKAAPTSAPITDNDTDKKPVKLSAKTVSPKPKQVPEPNEDILTEEPPTEPSETLSPKSRAILNKVSPSISSPKNKNHAKGFKLNHTRNMQDLFKADEQAVSNTQGESLGVKIEMKTPKINLNYELEKAYNAINSGQNEAAIETYKNILTNTPDNTQALFGLATLYHRARQLDKARPLYSRLLTISPQHRDGFNNFLVLLADEAPHEALAEMEKLEAKNPGFSTIPAQMAIIYQKLGEPDKATEKMFRAVALAPENLTYRYNLAIMLDKQKKYDEAAKLYRQLIEAVERGEKIPGNIANIQQRLTFISSNR